jgi:Heterokaryon incompatibility protein (HET)
LTLLVWIDTVCIDQSNISERNHQVQMMKHTYSLASDVWAWLGEEAGYSYWAMRFLSNRKRASPLREHMGLEQMLKREYWKRIWIIQEFSLGRKLAIHYGQKSTDWTHFEGTSHDYSPASVILRTRSLYQSRQEGYPLLFHLLERHVDSLCMNPKDTVYALVSMACDWESSGLEIDYSKTLLAIYCDVFEVTFSSDSAPGWWGYRDKQKCAVILFSRVLKWFLQVYTKDESVKCFQSPWYATSKRWNGTVVKELFL